MLIGELAERAGTSTRALRHYESHGPVRPGRSANGYRVYDEAEPRVVETLIGRLDSVRQEPCGGPAMARRSA